MSKSIAGFTVVLKDDISEESSKALRGAFMQMKGVVSVGELEMDPMDYVAMERARQEIGEKLFAILYPKR